MSKIVGLSADNMSQSSMPDERAAAASILRPDFGPAIDAPLQAVILVSPDVRRPVLEAICRHSVRLGFRRLTILTSDPKVAQSPLGVVPGSCADATIDIAAADRDLIVALRSAAARLDDRFLL